MSAKVRKLDANGEPLFGHGAADIATGDEATAALITYRHSLWATTWALDISAGMPWLSLLGVKPFSAAMLEGAERTMLLETPGVESVDSFSFAFTGSRKGTAQITVTTDRGNTISLQATT